MSQPYDDEEKTMLGFLDTLNIPEPDAGFENRLLKAVTVHAPASAVASASVAAAASAPNNISVKPDGMIAQAAAKLKSLFAQRQWQMGALAVAASLMIAVFISPPAPQQGATPVNDAGNTQQVASLDAAQDALTQRVSSTVASTSDIAPERIAQAFTKAEAFNANFQRNVQNYAPRVLEVKGVPMLMDVDFGEGQMFENL